MDEPIHILCVDDEKNVLRSIQRMFLEEDYEIHMAASREEGIQLLRSVSPVQIVISDYRMAGTNGIDFLRDVRENWPETVRIVLSGYADMGAVVSAINEGEIYKFIPKPWNEQELRVAILNALERYFLRKKNVLLAEELQEKNRQLQGVNQNLEKLVEERTAELRFQNRVLRHSQNILDALPVGVVGIETEGMIVQCNREGARWLAGEGGSPVGSQTRHVGSGALEAVVARVCEQGACSERVRIRDRSVLVQGVYMDHPNGQRGVILVLNGTGQDG